MPLFTGRGKQNGITIFGLDLSGIVEPIQGCLSTRCHVEQRLVQFQSRDGRQNMTQVRNPHSDIVLPL